MVIVSDSSEAQRFGTWFDTFVERSIRRKVPVEDFFVGLSDGLALNGFSPTFLAGSCKRILKIGTTLLNESSRLAFDYLKILFVTENIDDAAYSDALISFDRFDRLADVHLVIERIKRFVQEIKCSYSDQDACLRLCHILFSILNWTIEGLGHCLTKIPSKDQIRLVKAINSLLDMIRWLREDEFAGLLLYIYFELISGKFVPNSLSDLLSPLETALVTLQELSLEDGKADSEDAEDLGTKKEDGEHSLNKCLLSMHELTDNFQDFATPPNSNWQPFREDFIHRRHRPAILTLGSIFATFRVLKSADEIADSFLTIGDVLGISRTQMVFDVLRSGFLVQLDTDTAERPQLDCDREALANMYVLLKVPQVLSRLLDRGVPRRDIFAALEQVADCQMLLDELDAKKLENNFNCFLNELKRLGVLDDAEWNTLSAKRGSDKTTPSREKPTRSSRLLIEMAQKTKPAFQKFQDVGIIAKVFSHLVRMSAVDAVCSLFCADGTLCEFSARLAKLNVAAERPVPEGGDQKLARNRLLLFDSTFLLLSRIQYVYLDMRLDELVGGADGRGVFYSWTRRYFQHLDSGRPMGITADFSTEAREAFHAQQFHAMKTHAQPFWNAETDDFGAVVEYIPLVGELLLEEFRRGESPPTADVHNVLGAFRQMTCLWLCLVQWLETQPPSPARLALARTLRDFDPAGAKRSAQQQDDAGVAYGVARKALRHLAESRSQRERFPYSWLISSAQRQLSPAKAPPSHHTNEVPDEQSLKEVFLQAVQQGWASPEVISHINRCNKAVQQDVWCTCWMKQMMKLTTADEMDLAAELCLATALTYPVACLMEMTKKIVDTVLFQPSPVAAATVACDKAASQQNQGGGETESSGTTAVVGTSRVGISLTNPAPLAIEATVLAKMLLRVLTLLLWAEEKRREQKEGGNGTKGTSSRKRKFQSKNGRSEEKTNKPKSSVDQSVSKNPSDHAMRRGSLGTSDNESILQVQETTVVMEEPISVGDRMDFSVASDQNLSHQNPHQFLQSSASATRRSSIVSVSQRSAPVDAVQATISNVFERFERVLRDSCLRPTVTFIIFFIHELARAPRTKYWKRLVVAMPVSLMFTLARLDPAAVPLALFLSLYQEEHHSCLQYGVMMRKFGLV